MSIAANGTVNIRCSNCKKNQDTGYHSMRHHVVMEKCLVKLRCVKCGKESTYVVPAHIYYSFGSKGAMFYIDKKYR